MNATTDTKKARRLIVRIISYFFVFSLILSLVYSLVNLYSKYLTEVSKIRDSFVKVENTVLNQISLSLWQMDDTQLKFQLDATLKLPGVVYVEIIEKDNVLLSEGIKATKNFEDKKFELIYSNANTKNELGHMYMQVTLEHIKNEVFKDILYIVVQESLKFFILSIFLFIIVYKLIVKHLIKMSLYTNQLEINNIHLPLKLDKRIRKNSIDVLDSLSLSINKMRKKLLLYIRQKEKSQEQLLIANKNMAKEIESRKKIQEEIWLLNEQLEQKVNDRTKEYEKSNKELKKTLADLKKTQNQLIQSEKMASLGDLVAGISHEINTPVGLGLTGVTHFMEITQNITKLYSEGNLSQEEFEEYIKTSNELAKSINTNIVRAADLIRSFKQVAVDQSSEAKRIFNLNEYIREVLLSLRNITKKFNINIIVDCPEDYVVNSYPGAISQIITNLVANSFSHGYDKDDTGTIILKVEKNSEGITLTYKDDGKGIKKENLNKIYDPFFTTNREKGGSGLGLNIIYNIITTTLNGDIVCHSIENEGVEFIINIKLNFIT